MPPGKTGRWRMSTTVHFVCPGLSTDTGTGLAAADQIVDNEV